MTAAGPTTSDPAVGWASGPLGAVQAAAREIARQSAVQARAVVEFAATRPASADRPAGTKGAMSASRRAARPDVLTEVSEWAAQELVVALSISSRAAEDLLVRSLTLAQRLPATLTALEEGRLHVGHLAPLLDHVAPVTDDALRAGIEEEVLAWAGRRHRVTTPGQLRDKVRRVVLARDARAAARKLEAALRDRGVSLRPDADVAGMATLSAYLTLPEARAVQAVLGAYADALPDDPDRPARSRGQKMADALLDLVLRPGEHGMAPVQVQLLVAASVPTLLGGDAPAEVDGHVVPAEMVRDLLRALGLLPEPDRPPADPAPGTGTGTDTGTDEVPDADTQIRLWEAQFAAGTDLPDPADAPSTIPDHVLRQWAEEPAAERAEVGALLPAEGSAGAPDPGTGPGSAPGSGGSTGWWAEADRAVQTTGTALHELVGALGHAQRLVTTAEATDAADETVHTASPAGQVSAAPDAIAAARAAAATQRAALADLLLRSGGGGLADRPRGRPHARAVGHAARAHRCGRDDPRRHLRPSGLPPPAGALRPRPGQPTRPRAAGSHRRLPPRHRTRRVPACP
ncbi:DUF222 domain-containing protein [Blastococcus sp. SYSU D00820]